MTLLEVGRIDKPHGLRGEVVVTLTTTETVRVSPGTVLDAEGRALRVVSSRPHQHRWIVAFDGLSSREDADVVVGAVLRAEPLDDGDPDALWVHELIGSEVVEVDGTRRGAVVAVLANPASDLLELDGGALVPLRFVVSTDDGVITVDVPEGLFDLDED